MAEAGGDTAHRAHAVDILSAEQVYPNGTRALLPVDLAIREGEFVTLLGPSGCGKSTLLKMVAGLLAPTDGRILLWRKPVHAVQGARGTLDRPDRDASKRVSFVFQEATLMPWTTVQRNVELPLTLAGVSSADAAPRVAQALSLVGLDRFASSRPRELSGGMQMRVSIARGLVTEPQLLLMDEPFGALDEITRNRLDAELLDLWQRQKLTVVFVTHSIHEAVFLSSRVIVMAARPGRVVEQVEIDEPHPRGPAWRVSQRFAQIAEHLQDSLLKASIDTVDGDGTVRA
ncbi:MAG: ABC transporter ATP-binding protein [Leptothrix sp. (in: b-proteobacteria)]